MKGCENGVKRVYTHTTNWRDRAVFHRSGGRAKRTKARDVNEHLLVVHWLSSFPIIISRPCQDDQLPAFFPLDSDREMLRLRSIARRLHESERNSAVHDLGNKFVLARARVCACWRSLITDRLMIIVSLSGIGPERVHRRIRACVAQVRLVP